MEEGREVSMYQCVTTCQCVSVSDKGEGGGGGGMHTHLLDLEHSPPPSSGAQLRRVGTRISCPDHASDERAEARTQAEPFFCFLWVFSC